MLALTSLLISNVGFAIVPLSSSPMLYDVCTIDFSLRRDI